MIKSVVAYKMLIKVYWNLGKKNALLKKECAIKT
ncbi:MAG: hypothetical protein ACI971_002655, partial [Colwellia sp.]